MDIRPLLYIIGLMLLIMTCGMILPLLADLYLGNEDWRVFLVCVVLTSFFGGTLVLSNTGQPLKINTRQAFILTFISWIILPIFAALPFRFSTLDLNFTDSFFEAMSGLTTTGSTVITGLDYAPPGILLWRAILQWLGGIGIIIMALSILPFLQVGGMQIFRTELGESNDAMPKTMQLASSIGLVYVLLTIACAVMYMFAGMRTFDALAHALTTISTGGFSTYDASLGNFNSPAIDSVAIIFMMLGGMPFILFLKTMRGNARPLFTDSQVKWFVRIILAATLVTMLDLIFLNGMDLIEAFRKALFNVVSLITGTGYYNNDYGQWGSFVIALFFFLMVVGGCAGSTSCGIKIFRFQVFYAFIVLQLKKLIYPNGVFVAYYNGKPLPKDLPNAVMGFVFMYGLCFTILAIMLSFIGLDVMTSLSAAVATLSNAGPGLGQIVGPLGTYAPLPESAKWVLSFGMLLGRLEILTVMVMLHPNFWKP
ncbi:MAG: TrkH family potassium uptake protein [Micavibrio sp.]|nr:TrkH family potassium uptake protein [Micavibrio sp.]